MIVSSLDYPTHSASPSIKELPNARFPVDIASHDKVEWEEGQAVNKSGVKSKEDKVAAFASPTKLQEEIERAIDSVPVTSQAWDI